MRRDVVIGGDRLARAVVVDRHPGDPSVGAVDPVHLGVGPQVDARAAQVRDPGIDPHLARRPVEQAVGVAARAREVEDQLQQDVAAGARADLLRLRGDEHAREAVGQEAAKARRAVLGVDELPPRLLLPLPEAALVAARQQHQQPIDEEGLVLGRDAQPRADGEHELRDGGEVVERGRRVRGGDELVGAVLAREHHPVGGHQLVEDVVAWPRAGDPLHGVGQVAVEAGEEAEAVLGRQVVAPVGARTGTP